MPGQLFDFSSFLWTCRCLLHKADAAENDFEFYRFVRWNFENGRIKPNKESEVINNLYSAFRDNWTGVTSQSVRGVVAKASTAPEMQQKDFTLGVVRYKIRRS